MQKRKSILAGRRGEGPGPNQRMSLLELCLTSHCGRDGNKIRGMKKEGGEECWSVFHFVHVVCGKALSSAYGKNWFIGNTDEQSEYKSFWTEEKHIVFMFITVFSMSLVCCTR
jgi:hypothetical protein